MYSQKHGKNTKYAVNVSNSSVYINCYSKGALRDIYTPVYRIYTVVGAFEVDVIGIQNIYIYIYRSSVTLRYIALALPEVKMKTI